MAAATVISRRKVYPHNEKPSAFPTECPRAEPADIPLVHRPRARIVDLQTLSREDTKAPDVPNFFPKKSNYYITFLNLSIRPKGQIRTDIGHLKSMDGTKGTYRIAPVWAWAGARPPGIRRRRHRVRARLVHSRDGMLMTPFAILICPAKLTPPSRRFVGVKRNRRQRAAEGSRPGRREWPGAQGRAVPGKKKKRPADLSVGGPQKPGGVLLSHRRVLQYPRRWGPSLPCSEWERVLPPLYGHRENPAPG